MDMQFGTAIVVGLGWLISLCVHEFGHAAVAYIGGDKSVKDKGYLTLNPFRYTDTSMTIVLPLIILMIGGIALPGAAVYIDRSKLRNKFWHSLVSLAGPGANILCLLAIALLFKLQGQVDNYNWFWSGMAALALLQTIAIILNLLPVPPLDGYGVVEPWLPYSLRVAGANFSRFGILLLFGAFWVCRPLSQALWVSAGIIVNLLDIPIEAVDVGWRMFQKQSFMLMVGFIIVAVVVRQLKRSTTAIDQRAQSADSTTANSSQ